MKTKTHLLLSFFLWSSFMSIHAKETPLQLADTSTQKIITGYQFLDADSGETIATFRSTNNIANRHQIIYESQISSRKITIVALTEHATPPTGEFHMQITGTINHQKTEKYPPYTLFGDINGTYNGQVFDLGNYELRINHTNAGQTMERAYYSFSIVKDFSGSSIHHIDLATNTTDVEPLVNNQAFNAMLQHNFEVRYSHPNNIHSVHLTLTGPQNYNYSRTENVAPYALFGDLNGNFFGNEIAVGTYELTATPYTGANRTGIKGPSEKVTFQVSASISANKFHVIDVANTRITNLQLEDGMILNKNNFNGGISIEAYSEKSVGSVKLELTGPTTSIMTENVAPYTLFGNSKSPEKYNTKNLPTGNYNLKATSYSASNLSGSVIDTWQVSFSITDDSEDLNLPKAERVFLTSDGDAGPDDDVHLLYHNKAFNTVGAVGYILVQDSNAVQSVEMLYENYKTNNTIHSVQSTAKSIGSHYNEENESEPIDYADTFYNLLGINTNPNSQYPFNQFDVYGELGYNHGGNQVIRFSFTPYSGPNATGVRGVTTSLLITLWPWEQFTNTYKTPKLYPNPATEFITISGKSGDYDKMDIVDFYGRTIKTLSSKQINSKIDISDLKKGIYLLRYNTTEGIKTDKFIVN